MLSGKALYVAGAEAILDRLAALTRYARQRRIRILGSEDSHDPSDPEISSQPDWSVTFPPHCLAGSPGQRRVPQTEPANPLYVESPAMPPASLAKAVAEHPGEIFFRKQTFDVFQNPNVAPVLDALQPEAVVVYGVAQDVCVRFAIEGFLRRGTEHVLAVTDAMQALDATRGKALIEEWRARGVRTLTTAEVLAGAVDAARVGAG